jgi:phytoene dehydrogenase-like protein
MKAVIIGSGLGGLTTGAFLAKAGVEVTVLEKHFRIGGYAHNFKRKQFVFESGIHSVPFSDDGIIRNLLTQLGVNDKITTVEFPEMYRIISPEGEFIVPSRKEDAKDYLYKTFPDQKKGLDQFFSDCDTLFEKMMTLFDADKRGYRDEDPEFMATFHNKSFKDYLNSIFTNKTLFNLFSGQWPYVGITPESGGSLFLHMLFATHFFNGSFTVKGGYASLAEVLKDVIELNGGAVLTKQEVVEVQCDKKVAKSVKTAKGDIFEADILVSNISPEIFHNKLLPEISQSKRWKKRINNLNPSLSSVIVYLGMKESFRNKITGNITFWYKDEDQTKIYKRIMANEPYNRDHLVLLNSVEDIAAPTLTLMTFVQQSYSNNWKEDKKIIADQMIDQMEELFPGLKDEIELVEIGSPDTFERYTANSGGAIYGYENSYEMYKEAKMPMKSHIKNMYQTGHWGRPGCGVLNVMTNGFSSAKEIIEIYDIGEE